MNHFTDQALEAFESGDVEQMKQALIRAVYEHNHLCRELAEFKPTNLGWGKKEPMPWSIADQAALSWIQYKMVMDMDAKGAK